MALAVLTVTVRPTGLVTERVKCTVSVNECKRANERRLSVRLNRIQRENNSSSFGAFGGSTRVGFNVKTDEPTRARSTKLAGRTLPTPDLWVSQYNLKYNQESVKEKSK